MNMLEKTLVSLFLVFLKTKRIAKSAINGRISYHVKKAMPYAVGIAIVVWVLFVSVL